MAEDLSMPVNPILAKLFRVAKLAENTGYGFDKMIQGWQSYKDLPPQFSSDTSFIKSLFQWTAKKEEVVYFTVAICVMMNFKRANLRQTYRQSISKTKI